MPGRSWATDPAGRPRTIPPTEESLGGLEVVHLFGGAMPTGVSVSHTGRVFVCFPKWGDEVGFTVGEVRDGDVVAYPSQELNDNRSDADPERLVSVQSIVVDPADRLWLLDTGSPMFRPTEHGGPKLVCVDLATDAVVRTTLFPTDVALPTTYLNDVRVDLRRGEAGTASITDSSDSGPNGIIVVDLATGESRRRLYEHPSTRAPEHQGRGAAGPADGRGGPGLHRARRGRHDLADLHGRRRDRHRRPTTRAGST